MFHKELLKLYFICGTTTCQGKNLYTVVEEALKGGITLFQFREKDEGALEGGHVVVFEGNHVPKYWNVKE
ncbi:thiamine-phosphate pyrophosphorylase [Streptococcus pneumoniae]|nr:thiamine-phosphate pyrophosphorylase [Streptococcus pneumoniae]